uniref:G_PROTEIN_RECEP_F1_2 domain-containing protein n=1 Tax=Caenorhabditis japonica TaxID=281687 RepID=A0A8R1I6G3_CAEJA
MHINYYDLTLALQTYTIVLCVVGLFGNINLIIATCRHKSLRTKMGCLIMISTIAHTICLVSELIAVKLKLRFNQTHRDECFRSVIVYMFAMLFQSNLFLMMAVDLFLAVLMPIRHKLWRRGPYLFILCVPPLAFSCIALFIEEVYINHDDLLICTVTLAAPPAVRFWGTLITFSTILLAVMLIFVTAVKVHVNERRSARRILRHSNSLTSNTKCSDAKLLKSLSTLIFVFVCSWSLSILLSHISLYFTKSVAYEIQKYNILLSLPTFCQNFFVTGLRSPRYAKAYLEQLSFLPFVNTKLSHFRNNSSVKSVFV